MYAEHQVYGIATGVDKGRWRALIDSAHALPWLCRPLGAIQLSSENLLYKKGENVWRDNYYFVSLHTLFIILPYIRIVRCGKEATETIARRLGIQPFNFDTERRTIGDRNVVTIR